jgi:hypothetical protein
MLREQKAIEADKQNSEREEQNRAAAKNAEAKRLQEAEQCEQ